MGGWWGRGLGEEAEEGVGVLGGEAEGAEEVVEGEEEVGERKEFPFPGHGAKDVAGVAEGVGEPVSGAVAELEVKAPSREESDGAGSGLEEAPPHPGSE
jgi:hypothetical protein